MKPINELDLKTKKYIIFDMDGTLIDSIGIWNMTDKQLIKAFGNIDIDELCIQIERDNFLHSNSDTDIYLAYCKYLIQKYNFNISIEELIKHRDIISKKIFTTEVDFKSNAVELITLLKELGYTIVLATMTTRAQLDIYANENKKMYTQMNIYKVFDYIVTTDDVNNKKPDPEIYFKILQYFNSVPSECLIFEDSYTGILASNSAGIEVVNIYDKYSDIYRDKINAYTDYKIDNFQQFINYINKNKQKILKI